MIFVCFCFCLFSFPFVFVSVSAPGNHRWESYLFFRFARSRREAPPTAEGGGAPGVPGAPAPGDPSQHLTAGTRMFYARLGLIKVDGNNPQG